MTKNAIRIRRAQHDKENPYYLASRATAQDKTITYDALGMLNYILSKPDDWEVQPNDLQREGCKRNKVYRVLAELIEARYMERKYHRDDKGRVQLVEYIAHEHPLPQNQEMEKQEVDNQEVDNGDSTYKRSKGIQKDKRITESARETKFQKDWRIYGDLAQTLLTLWGFDLSFMPADNMTEESREVYVEAAKSLVSQPLKREDYPAYKKWLFEYFQGKGWTTEPSVRSMARHLPTYLLDAKKREERAAEHERQLREYNERHGISNG